MNKNNFIRNNPMNFKELFAFESVFYNYKTPKGQYIKIVLAV